MKKNKGIMVAVQVSLICNTILFIIKLFALPGMTWQGISKTGIENNIP